MEGLDKLEAARCQLGTATDLFLKDADPVSIHSLACAAAEIMSELAAVSGKGGITAILVRENADLTHAHLRHYRNAGWNAFKHASDRNGKARLDAEYFASFDDRANDDILFSAWFDYAEVTGTMPIEAQALQVWSIALVEIIDPSRFRLGFEKLQSMSRQRQKAQLRHVIARVRKRAKYVDDPRTENRPLSPRVRY